MHVISGDGAAAAGHHTGLVSAPHQDTAHDKAATAMPTALAADASCPSGCAPEHDLLMMVCVLALLVAALTTLTVATLQRHVWLFPPIRVFHRFTLTPATSRPPSLIVLSISRT